MKESDQILDQVLMILRGKRMDGYEVYFDQSSHFYVESKEAKVDTLQVSHFGGMAFRILNRHRVGFSYITLTNPSPSGSRDFRDTLERSIDDAMASGDASSADVCYDFSPVFKDPPPDLPIFDETLDGISEETKIERARCLEEAARSVDPGRIKKVRRHLIRKGYLERH